MESTPPRIQRERVCPGAPARRKTDLFEPNPPTIFRRLVMRPHTGRNGGEGAYPSAAARAAAAVEDAAAEMESPAKRSRY
jgi:hypothetical protein